MGALSGVRAKEYYCGVAQILSCRNLSIDAAKSLSYPRRDVLGKFFFRNIPQFVLVPLPCCLGVAVKCPAVLVPGK